MTRTIRARIHETAVKRVTRIYAATLADIFTETLPLSRTTACPGADLSPGSPLSNLRAWGFSKQNHTLVPCRPLQGAHASLVA